MSIEKVMLAVFMLLVLGNTVYALRTGRFYYGHVFAKRLYVERATRPTIFWALVIYFGLCGIIAGISIPFSN